MDKKLQQILTFALIAAVAFFVLPNLLKRGENAPVDEASKVELASTSQPVSPRWDYGGVVISSAEPPHVALGSLRPEDGYEFELMLDPRGASVYTAKLAGVYQEVWQKQTDDKTDEQLRLWSYSVLNPVYERDKALLPFSTQSIRVEGVGEISTFAGPVFDAAGKPVAGSAVGWRAGDVVTDADGVQRVSFTLNLYDGRNAEQPSYTLIKTYSVAKGDPSFDVSLRIVNRTGAEQEIAVTQFGPTGVPREDPRKDYRHVLEGRYVVAERKIVVPKVSNRDEAIKGGAGSAVDLGDNREGNEEPIVWAGQGNKFFACLMYPVPSRLLGGAASSATSPATQPAETQPGEALPNGGMLAPVSRTVTRETPQAELVVPAEEYAYSMRGVIVEENPTAAESRSQLILLESDPRAVAAGEGMDMAFDVYCGLKVRSTFTDDQPYRQLNYEDAIQFYSCQYCLISWLALAVMWLIETGGGLLGNYGIIIILMVFIVRLALHPITKKSQVNMMKMKKLGPEMQRIQEKYKDDKAAQQQAMMQFWKQHGASPFLGCLPMLLQMPIWVALWGGLSASGVLRHEGLLPFWITDLAGPDTVISWPPVDVPLLSGFMGPISGLNILPLLLAVTIFLQQKLMPMQSTAAATPEQQAQQKITMYMMSAMMLVFFYNMPSGLTLYIAASTAAGVMESFVIRKHIAEREAAEAAGETRIAAPGKMARGQRPKKPKGPFKY